MATATEPTLLDKLREQRLAKVDVWAQFIAKRDQAHAAFEERRASDEFKALSDEDRQTAMEAFRTAEEAFKVENDERRTAIEELDQRVKDQEGIEQRRNDAAAASARTSPTLSITEEALTYRWDNARLGMDSISYYRDLALVHGPGITLQGGNASESQARLVKHGQEMDVVMPERAKKRDLEARAAFEKAESEFWQSHKSNRGLVSRLSQEMRGGLFDPFEKRVEPNLAQGQGGYFSPPTWLVDLFIPNLRAHRVVANFPRQMPLPSGTSSINIPKLNALTIVGYQQQNNSGLPTADWADTAVQANIKTVGGFSDIALQLLELSPLNIIDEVVTTDLFAAHDQFLDGQIIAGDGVNAAQLNSGHLLGIYNGNGGGGWTGTNTVTYTDGSPSGLHLGQGVFGPMWSKIATNRFMGGQSLKFVLHPSRFAWYSTTPDANGRPIGETLGGGPYNVQARLEAGLPAEGFAATLPFLSDAPVHITANIPTTDNTDGGGANRDIAIAGLWEDSWLFEDALRTEVFREVLSGNMGVRFRLYGYKAFLVRYGQSFAVSTGSGFARPATPYGDFYR